MMFLLAGDVVSNRWDVGFTNRKRPISRLPCKRGQSRALSFDPFGGGFFYIFDRLAGQPSDEELIQLLPDNWLLANPNHRWESHISIALVESRYRLGDFTDLVVTDRPAHLTACHRWEELVALTDELQVFHRPVEQQGTH